MIFCTQAVLGKRKTERCQTELRKKVSGLFQFRLQDPACFVPLLLTTKAGKESLVLCQTVLMIIPSINKEGMSDFFIDELDTCLAIGVPHPLGREILSWRCWHVTPSSLIEKHPVFAYPKKARRISLTKPSQGRTKHFAEREALYMEKQTHSGRSTLA